jgi:hypothetical protein
MKRDKPTDLDAALATMSADGLRALVHELLLELDERTYARFMGSLIARAARAGSGWAPAAVSEDQVAEVLAFVRATKRAGQADRHRREQCRRSLEVGRSAHRHGEARLEP